MDLTNKPPSIKTIFFTLVLVVSWAAILFWAAFKVNSYQRKERLALVNQQLEFLLKNEIHYYQQIMSLHCQASSESIDDQGSPLIFCGSRGSFGELITVYNEFPIAQFLQKEWIQNSTWWQSLESNQGHRLILAETLASSELEFPSEVSKGISLLFLDQRFAIFNFSSLKTRIEEVLSNSQLSFLQIRSPDGAVLLQWQNISPFFGQLPIQEAWADPSSEKQLLNPPDFERALILLPEIQIGIYSFYHSSFLHWIVQVPLHQKGFAFLASIILTLLMMAGLRSPLPTLEDQSESKRLLDLTTAMVRQKQNLRKTQEPLEITLSYPESLQRLSLWPEQQEHYRSLLSPLLDNALESLSRFDGLHPHHKGRIILSFTLHKNGSLELSLEDNGLGIPDEKMPLLGQNGFTYAKPGHAGKGLHQVAVLLRRWGGSIKIASQLHEGTRVRITLPSSLLASHILTSQSKNETNPANESIRNSQNRIWSQQSQPSSLAHTLDRGGDSWQPGLRDHHSGL